MRTLAILALLGALNANANEYAQYYTNSSGQKMSAETAIINAVKGDQVYKCQSVEYKVSKSGTSIGVRNVKKPKVVKND